MTTDSFWTALTGTKNRSVADEIAKTRYDEILEFDLSTDIVRHIRHVENKYFGNVAQENVYKYYNFLVDHFVHPDEKPEFCAMYDYSTISERLAAAGGMLCSDFRIKGLNGSWISTRQLIIAGPEIGLPDYIIHVYLYDLNTEWQAETMMICDEITGLPGRLDFFHESTRQINKLGGGWCLIYLEIDHHKLFTDWYGLEKGQHMLMHVSEELQKVAQQYQGVVGYIGEAIFSAILPYKKEIIDDLYNRIANAIIDISTVDGFRPVIGIAPMDDPSVDIREYFNKAALTVEEIRDDMHTWIRVYDAELHKRNSKEYRILHEFEDALKNGDVTFYLQPQCRMEGRKIVGAEALTRWTTPEGEQISPAVFIPILEKYGLISMLDIYIWENVCKWIKKWTDEGHHAVPISVNVSQIDIYTLDVPEFFSGLVKKYGIDKKYIKIEITESAYVEDSNNVKETVRRLREMDFTVLMDDFGSGYSSLNMLNTVNIDVIKLDARFLELDEDDNKGVSILESVVNMARNLETPIIVEGVETSEQAKFLTELGCRYAQGFFFYRPMPLEKFEKLIELDSRIDDFGIVPKLNQQVRVLEIGKISESMLNNLVGPTAIYQVRGDTVDIIRYNEQFFRIVGMSETEFNERVYGVEQYVHPNDKEKLFKLFDEAEKHHYFGAQEVIRAIRPDGIITFLSLRVYFISEDETGKFFYVAAQDVSENQFISTDMPGAYFRCMTVEYDFEFLYLSSNFIKMTGFTEEELRTEFDNSLLKMIRPADVETVKWETMELQSGRREALSPFRIQRKRGDFIYVAVTCHVTDRYGEPCLQCILIDITEMMHNHNQMRVLSRFFKETVVFVSEYGPEIRYEVAINGLQDVYGLEWWQIESALNSGEFYTWIEEYKGGDMTNEEFTRDFLRRQAGKEEELTVHQPGKNTFRISVRVHEVIGDDSNIKYLIYMRLL